LNPRIFIEIPTWLGDAVMTSAAIENIVAAYPDAKLTLFGSYVSIEALKAHPHVEKTIIDESKKSGCRYYNLYKVAKNLPRFDVALSFRKRLSSKFLIYFIDAKIKGVYHRLTTQTTHQVKHYNNYVNYLLKINKSAQKLKLYHKPDVYDKPTLGINPGATYGSAKRWYPEKFAQVAAQLSKRYDIVIFGGNAEVTMANDIAKKLDAQNVKNYTNLAGKTSVKALIEHIAGLSLFITNDSGPMHVASAYQIPTIAIFGPTKFLETSQWENEKSIIVRKNLPCSPCMKRVCPLKTHECMQSISASEVIKAYKELAV
jgi:heptosyltransferase-2